MQIPESLLNYVPATTQEPSGSTSALGKDDFLKLLVNQLQYQDPENPVDDREFASQLAQFSSLEQMQNVSTGLSQLTAVMEQQGQYALLQGVGKVARSAGDALVADSEGRTGGFTLAATSAATRVTITDAGGTVLRTIDLGPLGSGDHTFTWDGTIPGGAAAPPGPYHFSVEATDGTGTPVNSQTYVEGTVTGVSLGDSPTVQIGDVTVPFSAIQVWKGGGTG